MYSTCKLQRPTQYNIYGISHHDVPRCAACAPAARQPGIGRCGKRRAAPCSLQCTNVESYQIGLIGYSSRASEVRCVTLYGRIDQTLRSQRRADSVASSASSRLQTRRQDTRGALQAFQSAKRQRACAAQARLPCWLLLPELRHGMPQVVTSPRASPLPNVEATLRQ